MSRRKKAAAVGRLLPKDFGSRRVSLGVHEQGAEGPAADEIATVPTTAIDKEAALIPLR
jgi:hypothetical protein